MSLLTSDEVRDRLRAGHTVDNLDTDNDGQVIIYTGIYRHSDGSYNDCMEVEETAHTD